MSDLTPTTEPVIVEGPGDLGPHEADKPVETGFTGSVPSAGNLTPEQQGNTSLAETGPVGPNVVNRSITGLSLPSPNTTASDPAAAFMPEVLTPVAGPKVAPGNPITVDATNLPPGTIVSGGQLVEPDYTDHQVAEAYQGAVRWTSPAGVEYDVDPETGKVSGKVDVAVAQPVDREAGFEDGLR